MSCKLLLVCFLLGFSLMASSLQALQVADNLRACFDIIEQQSVEAGNTMQNSFYELLDKVPEGRNIIDKCENGKSNNEAFIRCIIGDISNLREESLKSLNELQKALSYGSDRMTAIVTHGVDCVINVMVNAYTSYSIRAHGISHDTNLT